MVVCFVALQTGFPELELAAPLLLLHPHHSVELSLVSCPALWGHSCLEVPCEGPVRKQNDSRLLKCYRNSTLQQGFYNIRISNDFQFVQSVISLEPRHGYLSSLHNVLLLTRLHSSPYNFIRRVARDEVGKQGEIGRKKATPGCSPTLRRAACCMKTTGDESGVAIISRILFSLDTKVKLEYDCGFP